MLDDKICGTYWLCADKSGSLWLTKGNKAPVKIGECWFYRDRDSPMGWLQIGEGVADRCFINSEEIYASEFEPILHKLPKVTFENSPLEIEICKSGRVYYYESQYIKKDTETPEWTIFYNK